jgi:hypothetical protein
MKNVEEIQKLALAMTLQAYELNDVIPNIELMLFRMFVSPITTKAKRQKKDRDNLLAGNIFDQKGTKLGAAVYRSLLETVALHPKKKHFKKIIQHVIKHEGSKVDQSIIDLIVFIGIQQKIPIMLGQNMKYFLQNDYPVSVTAFKDFVLFLERCKGFEEDAKRFIILTHETRNVQIDYGLLRPMFLRAIKNKTGNDVL